MVTDDRRLTIHSEKVLFVGHRACDGSVLCINGDKLYNKNIFEEDVEPELLVKSDLIPVYCDLCQPFTLPWSSAPATEKELLKPIERNGGWWIIGTAGVYSRRPQEVTGLSNTVRKYHLALEDLELFTHTERQNQLNLAHTKSLSGKIICYWHVHSSDGEHAAVNVLVHVDKNETCQNLINQCTGFSWTTVGCVALELSIVFLPGRPSSLIWKTLNDACNQLNLSDLGYGRLVTSLAAQLNMSKTIVTAEENEEERDEDTRSPEEWKIIAESLVEQMRFLQKALDEVKKEEDSTDKMTAEHLYLSKGKALFRQLHQIKAHLEKALENASAATAATPPRQNIETNEAQVSVLTTVQEQTPQPSPPSPPPAAAAVPSIPPSPAPSSVHRAETMSNNNLDEIRNTVASVIGDIFKPQQQTVAAQQQHHNVKEFIDFYMAMQKLQQPSQQQQHQQASVPSTSFQVSEHVPQVGHSGFTDDKKTMKRSADDFGLSQEDVMLWKKIKQDLATHEAEKAKQERLKRKMEEKEQFKAELTKQFREDLKNELKNLLSTPLASPVVAATPDVSSESGGAHSDVAKQAVEIIKQMMHQQQHESSAVEEVEGGPAAAETTPQAIATSAAAASAMTTPQKKGPAISALTHQTAVNRNVNPTELQSAINHMNKKVSRMVPSGIPTRVDGISVTEAATVSASLVPAPEQKEIEQSMLSSMFKL